MNLETLALVLALFPLLLTFWNLVLYRPPAPGPATAPVSVLIPARDEEAHIEAAVRAVLASAGVRFEVVVLDDHSTDRTRPILERLAAEDQRLRVASAPPLPAGWNGKQHACHALAGLARHDLLLFVDADVRLAPDALARIAGFMERHPRIGLASGFPEEEAKSLPEKLVTPLIHFLLMGYLPMWAMRRFSPPGFGAACGQLICVRRAAYRRAGGHAAIRASRHDGVTLPRALRKAGVMTDLFDATDLARCRMYQGGQAVWDGFAKNATEGMATPAGLPVWTALLGLGQVLPFILLPAGLVTGSGAGLAAAAVAAVWLNRAVLAVRFRQSLVSVLLHPVGILVLLAIQWTAFVRQILGRPATWRGRVYAG